MYLPRIHYRSDIIRPTHKSSWYFPYDSCILLYARAGDWLNSFAYLIVFGAEGAQVGIHWENGLLSYIGDDTTRTTTSRHLCNCVGVCMCVCAASESTCRRTIYYIVSINVLFGWKGFHSFTIGILFSFFFLFIYICNISV